MPLAECARLSQAGGISDNLLPSTGCFRGKGKPAFIRDPLDIPVL